MHFPGPGNVLEFTKSGNIPKKNIACEKNPLKKEKSQ